MAVGAFNNAGGSREAGHTRMYAYDDGTAAWTQLGDDIDGEVAFDQSGRFVSLSGDGTRVAIAAPYNDGNGTDAGHVRIYGYDASAAAWTQLGADIDGEAAGDRSGSSVSLSADGTRVAIGAPSNDDNGRSAGHVRVYAYDAGAGAWVQLGDDIDGEAEGDSSGNSISLSADGMRVAVGAPSNDENGRWAGHTRVYAYDAGAGAWTQLGADIDGEAEGDLSGLKVALSGDGTRVAIGAPSNGDNGALSGHVRVYAYDASAGAWAKVGEDIDGEAEGDGSGWSVSLSEDGSHVAVGAYRNGGGSPDAGHARVYAYDAGAAAWTQFGADIDGESGGDSSGWSVSLSADGTRVAVGAPGNSGNGVGAGHARVFSLRGVSAVGGATPPGDLAGARAYPNPVGERLFVDLGDHTAAAVTLTDVLGRVLLRDDYDAAGFDVSHLPAGMYVLVIESGAGASGTPSRRTRVVANIKVFVR